MNSIGKLYGMFVAMILMFFFPMEWAGNEAAELEQEQVIRITDSFAKSLCADGEMTEEALMAFRTKLNAMKTFYGVEIECVREIYEPDEDEPGNVVTYDSYVGNGEITDRAGTEGKYKFYRGDRIYVTVCDSGNLMIKRTGVVTGEKNR